MKIFKLLLLFIVLSCQKEVKVKIDETSKIDQKEASEVDYIAEECFWYIFEGEKLKEIKTYSNTESYNALKRILHKPFVVHFTTYRLPNAVFFVN